MLKLGGCTVCTYVYGLEVLLGTGKVGKGYKRGSFGTGKYGRISEAV